MTSQIQLYGDGGSDLQVENHCSRKYLQQCMLDWFKMNFSAQFNDKEWLNQSKSRMRNSWATKWAEKLKTLVNGFWYWSIVRNLICKAGSYRFVWPKHPHKRWSKSQTSVLHWVWVSVPTTSKSISIRLWGGAQTLTGHTKNSQSLYFFLSLPPSLLSCQGRKAGIVFCWTGVDLSSHEEISFFFF